MRQNPLVAQQAVGVLRQRAAETVQAPDHERVLAVAQLLERLRKLGAFLERSGRGVDEAALAAGDFERV